jgi:hypothetical protein
MRRWAEIINAEIHNLALAAEDSVMTIATRETIIHATLLKDFTNPIMTDRYEVQVSRFDRLPIEIERPALCKIDVEGAELSVLQGMDSRIDEIDALVIEMSLISLYENGPELSEIMSLLKEKGFCLYDICSITRRPFDGALHQIDAVFVPDHSPLRVRRWS